MTDPGSEICDWRGNISLTVIFIKFIIGNFQSTVYVSVLSLINFPTREPLSMNLHHHKMGILRSLVVAERRTLEVLLRYETQPRKNELFYTSIRSQ